jgi:hypothetical protein
MSNAMITSVDFSDLRLDAIRVLDVRSATGASDFAASCGRNCNAATACSCTAPKAVSVEG